MSKKAKAERAEHRKKLRHVRPKSKKLGELQSLVNKCVRLRDVNLGCCSCDKPPSWHGQWHAGHYYSRGHSSALRFNLHNIHKQCSICNNHLSGNIGNYTPVIISRIGQQKYDALTNHKSDIKKYSDEWIERAIKIAKKAVKRYERRNLKLYN
jgi:hypothetical protein